MKNPWVELLKSAGRFLWFGFLGVVGALLVSLATDPTVVQAFVVVAGQKIQVGALLVTVIGFVAKALDRYIHTNRNTALKGIALPFLQR